MAGTRETRKRSGGKAAREAFFVLVEAGDNTLSFFNATEHVGKPMPFSKPQATCAMRVGPETVAFSLLRLTKNNTATIAEKPVTIPRGPLARLERRSAVYQQEAPLADGELIVEITTRLPYDKDADANGSDSRSAPTEAAAPAGGGLEDIFEVPAPADVCAPAASVVSLEALFDAPAATAEPPDAPTEAATPGDDAGSGTPKRRPQRPTRTDTYRCRITRDDNNVATVEELADEDTLIEVPRGAMNVSLYFRSPAVPRTLAIGFIGPLGRRPGTFESIARIASLVLNTATRLTEFRVLSHIETVATPAEPARAASMVRTPARRPEEKAEFPIKLYLFDAQLQPLVSGDVVVSFDLENANPTTGRLLVHYTPDEHIAGVFPQYRPMVDMAVAQTARAQLGDDQISEITYDIVLGGVDSGTVARLRELGEHLKALDVSPTDVRPHVG